MRPRSRPTSRSRSRWAALATALIVTAGLGLAALTAAPKALAENNGLVTNAPAMGWSSWSFLRYGPTAANIEAQAKRAGVQRPARGRLRLHQPG